MISKKHLKIALIIILVGGILSLHYFTLHEKIFLHAVYRMLFYVPLVLASFWFGFWGAVSVSGTVSMLYLSYVIFQWQGTSYDLDKILEAVLYVIIALILGYLVEKERRRHKALIRLESLAAIGRTLAEIAHDMKTPLIAIGGFARQVFSKLESSDQNKKKLDVIIKETARLESMVRGMLDFGKPIEMETAKTNLNQLVLDTTKIVSVMAKRSNIKLNVGLEPSLPDILLDRSRINQVLLNLISNAVQASPSGEEVSILTKLNNENVILEVIDHGCGIPKENLEVIFQPFVSLNKGGTGLGLAIVKKILDAHGSEISCSRNTENGVTFSVIFPIV